MSLVDGTYDGIDLDLNAHGLKLSQFVENVQSILHGVEIMIGTTHVFSCINICRVPRKLLEHEAVRPSVQTSSEGPGIPYFFRKLGKKSQNLSSAAVVIGALRHACNVQNLKK